MDVGADNFRFTLEDQNGRNKPCGTYRKAKTCELHISSLDRYKPTDFVSNAYFANFPVQPLSQCAGPNLLNGNQDATTMQIQTSRSLTQGYFSRVALTQMSLIYRAPTIAQGVNARLIMFVTGVGWTSVLLPQGYYTPASLAAAVTTAVQTIAGLGAFVCYPPGTANAVGQNNNQGFGFSTNSATTMYFGFPPAGSGVPGSGSFARLVRILGLDRACFGYATPSPAGSQETVAGTPWTDVRSQRACTMLYSDYIDVVSANLTNYKESKDTNTNIQAFTGVLGRIWLTEGKLSIGGGFQSTPPGIPYDAALMGGPIAFTKEWKSPNWCQWSPNQTIDTIDITLRDMFGGGIPWSQIYPTEFSATLTLTE